MFALDERLGAIVAATTEPTIGLIRLAWWRESLERLDVIAPPAEPLLQALAEEILPRHITGAELAGIEHGWSALLVVAMDAVAIDRHARERGARLFDLAARLLTPLHHPGLAPGSTSPISANGAAEEPARTVRAAGTIWSLADLAHRHSDPTVQSEARQQARAAFADLPRQWPTSLRPLGMLAALARRDLRATTPRLQGSPGRVLRMLALRLTGR